MASELRNIAFVLWPGTHPGTIMPGLSVLRSANRMAGYDCYAVRCYTLDEQPIVSEEGWHLPASSWSAFSGPLSRLWLAADAQQLPDSVPSASWRPYAF